ncbi:hypothetical protein NIIDMKKI_29840 [Mycobacterium kansasii]|uniref:Thioesterase TesA n=1 Tax=Mycobacterium kansasii TaxID=1768 RepID=A0A7G1IGU4_MYCKA|nr:hypothetical protein NIIDMKKI_29840 [Mycobacterium kansasii]
MLVGHSVGAYVASALAARLEQQGRPARAVVMSAVVPPAYLDPARPLSKMTDAQRLDWCRTLGTFPVGDKDSAALFALFAEAIRADCEVYESAVCVSLDHTTPLLVLVGEADPACPVQQVAHWPDTHPQAVIRTLPGGGHMLPQDAAHSYAAEVAGFLRHGRNGSIATRPVAGHRRPWRREDMWLRARQGRRCLPVIFPRGRDTPAALHHVLVENDCLETFLTDHGALLARGGTWPTLAGCSSS